jgi:eukaryotic translation initiation factor 2C
MLIQSSIFLAVQTYLLSFLILSFPCNDGTLTVVQYFKQRYKYQLQYTAWPCLQSGNDSKPIYLPMEVVFASFVISAQQVNTWCTMLIICITCLQVCEIIEGQKYSRKLSDTQVASILKATCKRPQERENNIIHVHF